MDRAIRHTLLACTAALLLAPLARIVAAEPSPDQPNVVIFLVDDMGVMDTSVPFLTDQTGKPDGTREETFLMHYPHSPHRSEYFTCYRHGDWKVIYHFFPSEASENSHYQLYNLAEDPFESNNLAPSRPDQLRRMMEGLIASLKEHNALYPVDKEDGSTPLEPKLP